MPVIDGENIDYFRLNPATEFVNFIPAAIKSGGNPNVYKQDRICIRQIGKVPIATYVHSNIYTLNTIYNVHLKETNSMDLKFLLGIICSNVVKYFWKKNHSDEKETYPKIKKEAILSIPIKEINNAIRKSKHDSIIRQVDNLLQLNKDLKKAKLPNDVKNIENRITSAENRLNEIVYELYGISKKEIDVIEQNL